MSGTFIKVRKGENWKEVVRLAIGVTPRIIILPGASEGLQDELKILRSEILEPERLFTLVPSTLDQGLLDLYSSVLSHAGFNIEAGSLHPGSLYTFTSDWTTAELVDGLETPDEAAHEVLAWCRFGNKPAALWCDFDNRLVQPTALGRCPSCGLILNLIRLESVWPFMGSAYEDIRDFPPFFVAPRVVL